MTVIKTYCDHCGKLLDGMSDYTDLDLDIAWKTHKADLCCDCFNKLFDMVVDYCSHGERKMRILTDKKALETAKDELNYAIYLSEYSPSAGIRAISENKAKWLSILIYNAEQYIKKEDEWK